MVDGRDKVADGRGTGRRWLQWLAEWRAAVAVGYEGEEQQAPAEGEEQQAPAVDNRTAVAAVTWIIHHGCSRAFQERYVCIGRVTTFPASTRRGVRIFSATV